MENERAGGWWGGGGCGGWVNTMSAIANQTRQELTDELLAMLDCGFGATLEIGRKLVGNWSFFPLTFVIQPFIMVSSSNTEKEQ